MRTTALFIAYLGVLACDGTRAKFTEDTESAEQRDAAPTDSEPSDPEASEETNDGNTSDPEPSDSEASDPLDESSAGSDTDPSTSEETLETDTDSTSDATDAQPSSQDTADAGASTPEDESESEPATGDDASTSDLTSTSDAGGCPSEGCDDGLDCNGVEQCVDGRCRAGQPACQAEPSCQVECEEESGGPQCSQLAADEDEDGAGSPECAAAPGSDCDDSDQSVFPDAEEVCDGVDQDCDGLEDLDEGFELSGEVREMTVGIGGISGAWSQELNTFAIADWFSSAARFRTVSLTGEASEPVPLDGVGAVGFRGELISGHGRFALGVPQDFGQFNLIDAAGLLELAEPAPLWSVEDGVKDVAVVATSTGWLALFTLTSTSASPQGRRFDIDGEALDPSALSVGELTDTPDGIEAAILGDEVGIVWDSAEGVYFSRYSDDLIKLESRSLNPSGRSSDIAARSDGYAVAWFETDFSLMYMELNADGEAICGPTNLGISLELNQQPHLSVAPYAGGYAVLYSDNASTRLHLLRVHAGCSPQIPPETVQEPSQVNKNDVRLNGNASGLIATWRDGPADPRYRVLGGALCDLPAQ